MSNFKTAIFHIFLTKNGRFQSKIIFLCGLSTSSHLVKCHQKRSAVFLVWNDHFLDHKTHFISLWYVLSFTQTIFHFLFFSFEEFYFCIFCFCVFHEFPQCFTKIWCQLNIKFIFCWKIWFFFSRTKNILCFLGDLLWIF